jgi:hypothetical protein
MESLAIPSQISSHRRPIQPVVPSTMTLRRQKNLSAPSPSPSRTSSNIKGESENNLASSHDSSAALTTGTGTALASATSASPAVARHPLQSGSPGRKGGVESQDKPGTADHDGRTRTRHTASEEGSERKGQQMNERRLDCTQQLYQELDTSSRVIGPRTSVSVSGASDVASGVAGTSVCGTMKTTSPNRTERRLPRIILKVKPPPGAGAGMG